MSTLRTLLLPGVVLLSILVAANSASAFYHPTQGRWLQRDPKGYKDSRNVYQCARSNPVRFTDSLGCLAQEPAGSSRRTNLDRLTDREHVFWEFDVKSQDGKDYGHVSLDVTLLQTNTQDGAADMDFTFKLSNQERKCCKEISILQFLDNRSLTYGPSYSWPEDRNKQLSDLAKGANGAYVDARPDDYQNPYPESSTTGSVKFHDQPASYVAFAAGEHRYMALLTCAVCTRNSCGQKGIKTYACAGWGWYSVKARDKTEADIYKLIDPFLTEDGFDVLENTWTRPQIDAWNTIEKRKIETSH